MLELIDELVLGSATTGGGGGSVNNQDITITANGVYTAGEGYTGIGTATVNVVPQLTTLNATANGTYTPQSPNVGYSSVVVNTVEADIVTATNTTGYAIASGDKVFIQKSYDGWNILALTQWIRNFGTNGTVTIDDTTGIASVSSTNRYVYFDLGIDYTKPWEFKTKVNYTSFETNSFIHCGKASSASMLTQAGFSLFICGNNSVNGEAVNTLQMIYDQNGTASQIGTTTNSIVENSINYLKCGWDGLQFYVACSTDGETWITKTQASTTPTTYTDLRHCLLGTAWTAQSYLHGSMYLKETYIYSNGAYLFSPYLMNFAPDYYIGFAQESIANNASGDVKTVLPAPISVSVTVDADDAEISVE